MILYLDTRGPENRASLYDAGKLVSEITISQRQLSEKLDLSIKKLLLKSHTTFKDLTGIIAHRGPGSFTGLRIGLSYANGLALGLGVPLIGTEDEKGLEKLLSEPLSGDLPVLPIYDSEPKVTERKGLSSLDQAEGRL